MSAVVLPDLDDVRAAAGRVDAYAQHTPLLPVSQPLAAVAEVRLKCDQLQPGGAFKLRGATNALLQLDAQQRRAGVVCASTGNHGRALAMVAAALGVPCTVCMSELVPQNKREAIAALGATLCIGGRSQDEAQLQVEALVRRGMTEIPPFDHAHVIAGQGTLGLELLQDWPEMDTVIVPLSGGGLISGVALALKSLKPSIRVVAVSPRRGAAMAASVQAGKPVEVEELATLADSLGGGIGMHNRYTLAMVQRYVDALVLLDEAAIAAAMRHLFFCESLVTEGAGAAALAVLLDEDLRHLAGIGKQARVAVVLSGRNIGMAHFLRLMTGEEVHDG
ncbi:threonine/serine dehydratase [Granulosicoccaceae sp. 1_MG-2023]|nr:threonine/serine dehydratase [Granulosicoccaceae sp. 1_MG-2023]